MHKHKNHDSETKNKALQMMMADGMTPAKVAAELGISHRTCSDWKTKANRAEKMGAPTAAAPIETPPSGKPAAVKRPRQSKPAAVDTAALARGETSSPPPPAPPVLETSSPTSPTPAAPLPTPAAPVVEAPIQAAPQRPQRPTPAAPARGDGVFVRLGADLADLNLQGQIAGLAADSGLTEAAVVRSLIMLGLSDVAREPGRLAFAVRELRAALRERGAAEAAV